MPEQYKSIDQHLIDAGAVLYERYESVWDDAAKKTEIVWHPGASASELPYVSLQDLDTISRVSSSIVSSIPDRVFTDSFLRPTSHLHLEVLLDLVAEKQNPSPEEYFWYKRLYAASTVYRNKFQMGYGNVTTDDVFDEYFSSLSSGSVRDQKRHVAHAFVTILGRMMPYAAHEIPLSDTQFEDLRKLEKKSYDILKWHLMYDERKRGITKRKDMITVNTLRKKSLLYSPRSATERSAYDAISPKAVRIGNDTLPFHLVIRSKISRGIETPEQLIDAEALVSIHESIHTLSRGTYPVDDFHSYMNELITDSAAESIVLQAKGRSLKESRLNSLFGYQSLRNLAAHFVRYGWVKEDDIIRSAIDQNPMLFCSYLHQGIHRADFSQSERECTYIIDYLSNAGLIPSVSSQDVRVFAFEFYQNPYAFLKEHMGSAYAEKGSDHAKSLGEQDKELFNQVNTMLHESMYQTGDRNSLALDVTSYIVFSFRHTTQDIHDTPESRYIALVPPTIKRQILDDVTREQRSYLGHRRHPRSLAELLSLRFGFPKEQAYDFLLGHALSEAMKFRTKVELLIRSKAHLDESYILPHGTVNRLLSEVCTPWYEDEDVTTLFVNCHRYELLEGLVSSVLERLDRVVSAFEPPPDVQTDPQVLLDQVCYFSSSIEEWHE